MLMMAPPIFEAVESVIAQYDKYSIVPIILPMREMCDEMTYW